jgi:hypothetical protein
VTATNPVSELRSGFGVTPRPAFHQDRDITHVCCGVAPEWATAQQEAAISRHFLAGIDVKQSPA